MEQARDPSEMSRQRARCQFEDGTLELQIGMLSFGTGLVFWLTSGMIAPLLWLMFSIVLPRGMRRLREREVIPRVGYVPFPELSRQRRMWAHAVMLLLMVATSVLIFFYRDVAWRNWTGIGMAVTWAICFLHSGVRLNLTRLILVGALALVLAALLYRTQPGLYGGMQVMAVLGAALALSGAWQLWKFVRTHPRA